MSNLTQTELESIKKIGLYYIGFITLKYDPVENEKTPSSEMYLLKFLNELLEGDLEFCSYYTNFKKLAINIYDEVKINTTVENEEIPYSLLEAIAIKMYFIGIAFPDSEKLAVYFASIQDTLQKIANTGFSKDEKIDIYKIFEDSTWVVDANLFTCKN